LRHWLAPSLGRPCLLRDGVPSPYPAGSKFSTGGSVAVRYDRHITQLVYFVADWGLPAVTNFGEPPTGEARATSLLSTPVLPGRVAYGQRGGAGIRYGAPVFVGRRRNSIRRSSFCSGAGIPICSVEKLLSRTPLPRTRVNKARRAGPARRRYAVSQGRRSAVLRAPVIVGGKLEPTFSFRRTGSEPWCSAP
jgi:hypothetical protein